MIDVPCGGRFVCQSVLSAVCFSLTSFFIAALGLDPMGPEKMDRMEEEDWLSLTGLNQELFEYVFDTYCGGAGQLTNRWQLFELLWWYKQYPTFRAMKGLFTHWDERKRAHQHLCNRMKLYTTLLWQQIRDVIPEQWELRDSTIHPANRFFGSDIVGAVDTFPIRVRRPKCKRWRKALYNGGKYKANVVKFQLIVAADGMPLHLSGPFPGVRSDLRIWRTHAYLLSLTLLSPSGCLID